MCPRYCRVELRKVRVKDFEVDQCPSCQGVWFDAKGDELLETLRVGYGNAPEELKQSWEAGGGKISYGTPHDYNCPRCGSLLVTYMYMGNEGGSFEIDGCRKGCGVWLDDGELDSAYQTLKLVNPAALKPKRRPAKPGTLERILSFLLSR